MIDVILAASLGVAIILAIDIFVAQPDKWKKPISDWKKALGITAAAVVVIALYEKITGKVPRRKESVQDVQEDERPPTPFTNPTKPIEQRINEEQIDIDALDDDDVERRLREYDKRANEEAL